MQPERQSRFTAAHARLMVIAIGCFLLAIIWVSYSVTSRSIQASFERSTVDSMRAETLLLDDQLHRSLASIASQLTTIGQLTDLMSASPETLMPPDIARFIGDTRIVRSLSLVNPSGAIVTSSNPANLGQKVDITSFVDDKSNHGWRLNGAEFSPLMPYRDLVDWATGKPSPTQEMMAAAYPVTLNGQRFYWVATVNVAWFRNFWLQIENSSAIGLAVLTYDGKQVIGHNASTEKTAKLFATLRDALRQSQIGHFYLQEDARYLVVYRSYTRSPLIVASIVDMDTLGRESTEDQNFLLWLAGISSLVLLLVLLLSYQIYLRYQRVAVFSRSLLEGMTAHVMMAQVDLKGRIQQINDPLLAACGYQRQEVIGKDISIFKSGLEKPEFFKELWSTLQSGNIWQGTFRNKTKSGDILWLNSTIIPVRNEWRLITHYAVMYSDITQAIRASQDFERERRTRQTLESLNQQLLSDVNTDPLTGVSNRRGFEQFIEEIRRNEALADASISVLILDIDHFKQINDKWGHPVGDAVLKAVSAHWLREIRSSDLLARLGGEEFVIILLRTSPTASKAVAEKIRQLTEELTIPIQALDEPIKVTVSIGLSHATSTADTHIEVLMKQADKAMYGAKRSGRNQVGIANEASA